MMISDYIQNDWRHPKALEASGWVYQYITRGLGIPDNHQIDYTLVASLKQVVLNIQNR